MVVMRDQVVKALAELEVTGNEDGLIPAFGVLVNQLPTSFWNTFSERIMAEAKQNNKQQEVEDALINCAYECGYHTGWGIINSEEFKSVVSPMVTDGAKDVLRGAYAVFTAWGWAKSGIVQIKEGERMVIRATDYYEQDSGGEGHRAYMIRGVSSAFFELAYSDPYPDGMGKYNCNQTMGIETGDDFGEFVVQAK
ncbi:MAG: hypothetical protein JXR76_08715 [Deltaproteobacteria bacterium]|nr:hypothetical protein [Deltaproteobacteria bacterium]